MSRKQLLTNINQLLSRLVAQVQLDNEAGYFDINRMGEDILLPIFRVAYDLPGLENLNVEKKNYPGLDLGDRKARVAFQITSNADDKKIAGTLRTIIKHQHYDNYDTFNIFGISAAPPRPEKVGWATIIDGKFRFDESNLHNTAGLFAKLSSLPIEKIEAVEQVLMRNVGEGDRYSFSALKKACRSVSETTVRGVFESRTIVERPAAREAIADFLSSSIRYCVLSGPSGVGKSTVSGLLARDTGRQTVPLFFPVSADKLFSLDAIADEVRTSMGLRPATVEWHDILGPWADREPEDDDGSIVGEQLLIILDRLESADPDHIAQELAKLHRSLSRTHPRLVKVVLSCRDTELDEVLHHKLLPFYTHAVDLRGGSLSDYTTVELGEFSNRELDAALGSIGAHDLISEVDHRGRIDDHIASMRCLLKHPGTFEHFAALYSLGEITSVREETWSGLIGKRLKQCFREVEQLTGLKEGQITQQLLDLVTHCRRERIRDFGLPIATAEKIAPGLFVRSAKGPSLREALVSAGVLTSGDTVAFRVTDAGGYLLSIRLQEDLDSADEADRKELVSSWLKERWNYWPVADGFLAMIDRLATSVPRRSDLLGVALEAVAASHHESSWFRLMKPSVLEFLFQKVREDRRDGDFYEYRDAARNVRYSPQNEDALRRHLADYSSLARELAAELVGKYRLASFVPDLIERLGDEDREVRHAALNAFGKIGPAAIEELLAVLNDDSAPEKLKSSVTWALINIGVLTGEISKSIAMQIPLARERKHSTLIRNLILLSAQLRDRDQAEAVAKSLGEAPGNDELRAVAKYFAEVPEGLVFDTLAAELVAGWQDPDLERRWSVNQILATLVGLDRERAAKLLAGNLKRVHEIKGNELVNFDSDPIFQHDLHEAYPTLYEAAIGKVRAGETKWATIRLLEELGKVWSPAGLEFLAAAAAAQPDAASALVEALLPNIGDDEYQYGDRLNRVRDLNPVIKAQDPAFPRDALRLLPHTSPFGTDTLGDYYWILGAEGAERHLLDNFKGIAERTGEPSDGRRLISVTGAARPLGTCGTRESADAVLDFLRRGSTEISNRFGGQVVMPMLLRGVCTAEELVEIVDDVGASRAGRGVCMEVLRDHDAAAHADLFAKILVTSSDEFLLTEAVFGLGVSGSPDAVRPLRELLRRTGISRQLKGYAARSVAAGLNAKEALGDIEHAFSKLDKYDFPAVELFTTALVAIGEKSSLRVLANLGNMPPDVKQFVSEATAHLNRDAIDRRGLAKKLETASGHISSPFHEQSHILKGILRRPRNELLEIVAEDLEKRRLNSGSQGELVNHLWMLAEDPEIDDELVARIAVPLIVDPDHELRYKALPVLDFLGAGICRRIFERITESRNADERSFACAVESLGYWDCEEATIRSYRYHPRRFVRQAADLALRQRSKRAMLEYHLDVFRNETGMKRLGSYLCLCENGDRHTIRRLRRLDRYPSIIAIQAGHVEDEILERLNRERHSMKRDLEKRYKERGVVTFG